MECEKVELTKMVIDPDQESTSKTKEECERLMVNLIDPNEVGSLIRTSGASRVVLH